MKFLQTGDLHLGKTVYEYSLYEDQKYMLHLLKEELQADSYDALFLTGDIYDRSIPSVEAVELFSSFLADLQEVLPHLCVYIIPGNHDSAKRLSFADRILSKQNIFLSYTAENCHKPFYMEKNGQRAALYLIPFLSPDFTSGNDEQERVQTQEQIAEYIIRKITAQEEVREKHIPAIVLAHMFTIAAEKSESERHFLGTAEQVSPTLFASFTYSALGHLHKAQRIGERIYYAGSPLAYSFDEASANGKTKKKHFLKIDLNTEYNEDIHNFPISVTEIPIEPLHNLRRFYDEFSAFYNTNKYDAYNNDFLEFEFTDSDIVENPMALLRNKFPLLASLRQNTVSAQKLSSNTVLRNERNAQGYVSITDDFAFFLEDIYGSENTAVFLIPEKKELFEIFLKQESAYETE